MIISNFTVSLSHYKDAELYSLWSVIVLLSDESSRHFCSGLTEGRALKADICLQCFDAVGWVAGRASGL